MVRNQLPGCRTPEAKREAEVPRQRPAPSQRIICSLSAGLQSSMSLSARPGFADDQFPQDCASYTPSVSSDCKPQLCKRHILANSSVDATIQPWIAARVLAVLRFDRSLTKARLQSALMEGIFLFPSPGTFQLKSFDAV